jgi:predicted Zn-dependent peptidase
MSDVRITQLDSGLTVATERVPGARSVAIGAWVGVGARDEPEHQAGVSHFLEHLLFKGTAHRSSREIATAIERVGGDLNAFTTKEYTAFYGRVPAGHLVTLLDVLGDVLVRPALRDADVESERSVILEELAMDDDSPEDVVHQNLAEALFPGHPLGRETAGHRHTVEAVTADDVRSFFSRWYTAPNTVVAVAGPGDHDTQLDIVARAFSGLVADGDRPERSAPVTAPQTRIERDDDIEQGQVAVGMRALPRADDRREALDVLNHALGGGPSSRLFDEIRERRGLAYTVYSAPSAYCDAGALSVYAGTGGDKIDTVLGLIGDQLDALVRTGVTQDEVDVAIGYLTGSFLMGLEDTGSRMGRLGGQLVTTGSVRSVEEQIARWQAVTVDDVSAVADAVLRDRTISVLRPAPE